jgi:hypothetical protein
MIAPGEIIGAIKAVIAAPLLEEVLIVHGLSVT